MNKLTFIGAGNMAEALVRGIVAEAVLPPHAITVSDVIAERMSLFQESFGVNIEPDNRLAVAGADAVVLAVKPQTFPAVLPELAKAVEAETCLISIAAGIRTAYIEKALGGERRVVRVMPNTPALVGAGMSCICGGRLAREADLDAVEELLGSVGTVLRVGEAAMDAVTALSGTGPAYVFYLIEGMLAAAERFGMAPELALTLTVETVAGAAELLRETGVDPAELRRRVTSKGGTTEAAMRILDGRDVRGTIVEAIEAARRRSEELSG